MEKPDDLKYPIDRNDGWWFVWSMPPRYTIERARSGLELFNTYDSAYVECCRRNLARAEAMGVADTLMPGSLETFRDFYTGNIAARTAHEGCSARPE